MNQPPSGSTSPRMKTIRSCQPAGRDADPGLRAPYAAPGRVYPLGKPLGEEHAGGWVPCLWPSQAQRSSS
jgi:hypothetical protein